MSLSGLYSFPLFPLVNMPISPKNVAFPQGLSLDFPPLSFMTFSFSFLFFFKPIVVRKLQEFELPYVSVASLRSQEYKIMLRKRSGLGLEEVEGAGLDYGATY